MIAPIVADIRRRAAAAGRNPAEILIFTMMTVITAATSEAARAKLEDYRSYVSEEGALVLMSGWTGVVDSILREFVFDIAWYVPLFVGIALLLATCSVRPN